MYTFKKEERLCSKKLLTKLFHSGSSFISYPFRITWLRHELTVPAQVVISVPKRTFKRAVDRNLIKRRIREIYRHHKNDTLYSFTNHDPIALGIAYIGKEITEHAYLEKKMLAMFSKLNKLYQEP